MSEDKYEQLRVATQDLLCELNIRPSFLRLMAKGYSPSYPGTPETEKWEVYPSHKVQLSQVVANKLLDAGILEEDE